MLPAGWFLQPDFLQLLLQRPLPERDFSQGVTAVLDRRSGYLHGD